MSITDALLFIKQLKDVGGDQREEYYMFLEIMKDFKAQRYINVPITILFFAMACLYISWFLSGSTRRVFVRE